MITVVVYINETPIIARSAVNTGKLNKKGETIYKVDDGSTIEHMRGHGAVPLAKAMLDTVKEVSK